MKTINVDKTRKVALLKNEEEALEFAVEYWFKTANEAIKRRGFFAPALSGGSTPKAIYKKLASEENRSRIDWTKVYLFWGDERAVSPNDKESNYHMAMEEAGLKNLPIPKEQIFRMKAEKDIQKNALEYEKIILEKLGGDLFDLQLLGLGEDGHTASLFPHTEGLHVKGRLVIANFIPEKKIWRMTLTFDAINKSRNIVFYVIGENKREILNKVLSSHDVENFPSTGVGTPENPALFITEGRLHTYSTQTL